MDARIWEPLWRRLTGFRHVGIDLPGHGGSRPLRPGTRLGDFGRAVMEIADATEATHLVGLSFGGTVALQAAIDNPRRFSSICLASPGLAGGPQDDEAATCNIELMSIAKQRGIGPWLAERWMSVPPAIFEGARKHPELFGQLEHIVGGHSFSELLDESMAMIQHDHQSPRAIAEIQSPTLLLIGEHDMEAFKRSAQLIHRQLKTSSRVYMPGCGHLGILEDPEQGARLITTALSR